MNATAVTEASAGIQLLSLARHTISCPHCTRAQVATDKAGVPCIASYCDEGQRRWASALSEGMAKRRARTRRDSVSR